CPVWVPAGSEVLPANLLQCRLPTWVTASFWHPPAVAWGPPWGVGGQPPSPGPAGYRGISAPKPGALPIWM
ncbi:unnamed protein product, partial [Coccothraustes coccothraustes]